MKETVMPFEKTVFAPQPPPEAAPAAEAPERKPPQDFFEFAAVEESGRGRVFIDAKRGVLVLVSGKDPGDVDFTATLAATKFLARLKSLGVDRRAVVQVSGSGILSARFIAASGATLGPYADVEAGFAWRSQLEPPPPPDAPAEKEVPRLVVAKVIRDEIVPEQFYDVPLDGTSPELSGQDLQIVMEFKRLVQEARLGLGTEDEAQFVERLQTIFKDQRFAELLPAQRLLLYLEVKTRALGSESSALFDALLDLHLEVGEELAVSEIEEMVRDMKARDPDTLAEARTAILDGVRYDRDFQDLSDEAKWTLTRRLERRGLLPGEPARRDLLSREQLVVATDAGPEIAILIARGSADSVINLTEDLPAGERESFPVESGGRTTQIVSGRRREVTATLHPGDVVIAATRADIPALTRAVRKLHDRSPASVAATIKAAGIKTAAVLKAVV